MMTTPERRRRQPSGVGSGGGSGGAPMGHDQWGMNDYWRAVDTAREFVGTSQPWNRFVGWQGWDGRTTTMSEAMQAAWSVPTQAELGARVSQNLTHYLSNYAVVCMITLVYVVFTHLGLLAWSIVLALLYLAWDKRHLLAARAGVTFPDIQLPLKPQHATLIFAIVGVVLIISLVGHDVFVFIGLTSSLVLSHAAFRTPRSENAKKSDSPSHHDMAATVASHDTSAAASVPLVDHNQGFPGAGAAADPTQAQRSLDV